MKVKKKAGLHNAMSSYVRLTELKAGNVDFTALPEAYRDLILNKSNSQESFLIGVEWRQPRRPADVEILIQRIKYFFEDEFDDLLEPERVYDIIDRAQHTHQTTVCTRRRATRHQFKNASFAMSPDLGIQYPDCCFFGLVCPEPKDLSVAQSVVVAMRDQKDKSPPSRSLGDPRLASLPPWMRGDYGMREMWADDFDGDWEDVHRRLMQRITLVEKAMKNHSRSSPYNREALQISLDMMIQEAGLYWAAKIESELEPLPRFR
jgi:hypothetical protein